MSTRSSDAVLNESFLEVRAKLLEVAATLDRVDRAKADHQSLSDSTLARRDQIKKAIELLLDENDGRAEKLQKLFSREYQPDWRATMKV